MAILVINCGSSSLKFQIFDHTNITLLAKGLLERIGQTGSILNFCDNGNEKKIPKEIKNHQDGVEFVLKVLIDEKIINGVNDIIAVGHRVVHGGEKFKETVIIDNEVLDMIKECVPLAPLHNPVNLMGIEACMAALKDTPQIAVFDTAFHQTIEPSVYLYALPYELYQKHGIRRYGFHGTSHKYVSQKVVPLTRKPKDNLKIITAHLGNGSSITAIKDGKSFDTSMGLTPLEGLVMGTRCGDLDPAIVWFLMERANMNYVDVDNLMNKKSGLLGISGRSNDLRDLFKAKNEGDKRAALAIEIFCYRLRKYIGAYAAAMGGLDILIFTAGIGENSPEIREMVCKDLGYLGININHDQNHNNKGERLISEDSCQVEVWVVPTDEELMIARESMEVLEKARTRV